MNTQQCEYRKTYNGTCDQKKSANSDLCYYHKKVREGLIETDEQTVLLEMPSIAR